MTKFIAKAQVLKSLLIAIFIAACAIVSLSGQITPSTTKTIVIDPGHGGKDHGTTGSHSKEKDITLSLSLKLKAYIQDHYPLYNVQLTRSTDEFIKLKQRSKRANELNADLFISIHCNHVKETYVKGTEIYLMGLSVKEENIEIAKRENRNLNGTETDVHSHINSTENHILMNMYQYNYLNESAEIGSLIKTELSTHTSLRQRGVKQAAFSVLKRATMPGILLETAYLSNSSDETYLLSEDGQDKIVKSLAIAINTYFNQEKQFEIPTASYTILLLETDTQLTQDLDKKWREVKQFQMVQTNEFYQYYTETFSSYSMAASRLAILKKAGFNEAKLILLEQ